ncbi:MAG TPA: serine--tRNA ligase [Acidimicrobiales bacterium]|nr:serine--tRNA ligase [Acidimicrobiales bacterium]
MLDVRRLRHDPDGVTADLARRGIAASEVKALVDLDMAVRGAAQQRDEARAGVKRLSKEVGAARKAGDTATAERLQTESRVLGEQASEADAGVAVLEEELRQLLLVTPNTPDPEAPDGAGPEDNRVMRMWTPTGVPFNEAAYADCQRVPHWEVAAQHGLLDAERGAKLSGSMFPLWRGKGARLLRGLTSWALDRHTTDAKDGAVWEEVRPPTLVKTATMVATGHLPKFEEDMYHLERDDLWAIPTAEVPLTSLARDELLDADALPLKLCAYTPCFRREAGSAGRDTRGLLRSHEFDKVELMAVCTAEQAHPLQAEILTRAEGLLRDLGLAYRVLDLCAGDLGPSSMRTFDLEVWSPGVGSWLEVSSVSRYGDYQGRRAGIRHRVDGGGTAVASTVNGSALAWPRVVAALLEAHRQEDGSVRIPPPVRPWVGGLSRLG